VGGVWSALRITLTDYQSKQRAAKMPSKLAEHFHSALRQWKELETVALEQGKIVFAINPHSNTPWLPLVNNGFEMDVYLAKMKTIEGFLTEWLTTLIPAIVKLPPNIRPNELQQFVYSLGKPLRTANPNFDDAYELSAYLPHKPSDREHEDAQKSGFKAIKAQLKKALITDGINNLVTAVFTGAVILIGYLAKLLFAWVMHK
jgi:hypothetical protein